MDIEINTHQMSTAKTVKRMHSLVDFWLGQQLRAHRKQRKLSLQTLASEVGLSVGALSQIERGISSAPVKTLSKLSMALDVSMNSLLAKAESPEKTHHGWVARLSEHRTLNVQDKKIIKEVITPVSSETLDMYRVRMKPGGSTGTDLFISEAREISGVMIEGQMELWIGSTSVLLKSGDSFCFPGGAPRRWTNPGDIDNYVIWVTTRSL